LKQLGKVWEVMIPEKYKTGHEQHFASVAEKYLQYLHEGRVPQYEVDNMIAKYYTTTAALQKTLEQ
jgi:hypothetical protein